MRDLLQCLGFAQRFLPSVFATTQVGVPAFALNAAASLFFFAAGLLRAISSTLTTLA